MNEKIRIVDTNETALEVTLEEGGFLRFITDADKLPQGKGVWLDPDDVASLIVGLARLWEQIRKGGLNGLREAHGKDGQAHS